VPREQEEKVRVEEQPRSALQLRYQYYLLKCSVGTHAAFCAFFFFSLSLAFFTGFVGSSSSSSLATIHATGCRFHHGQSGKQICAPVWVTAQLPAPLENTNLPPHVHPRSGTAPGQSHGGARTSAEMPPPAERKRKVTLKSCCM